MIFETHAHYDDEAFDADREEIFAQFPAAGIGRVVDPASTLESNARIEELTQQYDFLYGAFGLHPSECEGISEDALENIRQYLHTPKAAALGEIGLDYHRETPERGLQQTWFRRQLDLAREEGKPVIIHSRDAAQDTLQILKEMHAEQIGGVIHCYSYSAELADEFLKLGFYIGVGGVVTFKNGRKLKETVQRVPLDRIVLETDCPYLAPVPYRGKRNCSLYLPYVAQAVAELKGMEPEAVIGQTWRNACGLYHME